MAVISRGERIVLTLTGKRNAGKSSLINALAQQEISIVSDVAGTTTDPVAKHYELLPLGPVTFYDTAGIDDVGDLGELRVKATRKILWRTDIAIVVIDENGITEFDNSLIEDLKRYKIPFVTVFNKADLKPASKQDVEYCRKNNYPYLEVSTITNYNIRELKELLIKLSPAEKMAERVLLGDLVQAGDTVVLVVPIDLAAPKGRLILPQVHALREILDNDAIAVTVKEKELEEALANLKTKPKLVITDSQVILKVAGDVPADIPLTTFSTLFARYKGELDPFLDGVKSLESLQDGDLILIAEACSHHVQADDIGRVKIPRWLLHYTGKDLKVDVYAGHDFPEDLEKYKLVIHCGGCMSSNMEMMRRIRECQARNVPITNYGIIISRLHGLLDRVIAPLRGNQGLS